MIPYLALIIVILMLGVINRETDIVGRPKRNFCVFFACVVFTFVSGFRADTVGADTYNYQQFFLWVSSLNFSEVASTDTLLWNSQGTEVTYKYFNWLIGQFFKNPQSITMACAIVLAVVLFLIVIQQSKDPWLSILLFVCLGFFQTSMNIAPSCIASLCVLLGCRYVIRRSLLKFLGCIALGCIFHYSALLFLPIYLIPKLKLSFKFVLIYLLCGFMFLPVVYPLLVNIMGAFAPDRWSQYLTVSRINLSQLLVWLFYFVLFIFARFVSDKSKRRTVELDLYNGLFLIVGLAYALTLCSTSFSRIAILFAPFLILAIPEYLSIVKSRYFNKRGSLANRSEKYLVLYCNHAKTIIVVVSIVIFAVRLLVNNIGMTIPYEICF